MKASPLFMTDAGFVVIRVLKNWEVVELLRGLEGSLAEFVKVKY